jgi:hypothetical protein
MWFGKHQISTLSKQLEQAESCETYTLPGKELRALLNLVDRIKSPEAATLARVRAISQQSEICLLRDEITLLLKLAIEAKLRQLKTRQRVARPAGKPAWRADA